MRMGPSFGRPQLICKNLLVSLLLFFALEHKPKTANCVMEASALVAQTGLNGSAASGELQILQREARIERRLQEMHELQHTQAPPQSQSTTSQQELNNGSTGRAGRTSGRRRGARVYRIRATEGANGQLGPPIRVLELGQVGGGLSSLLVDSGGELGVHEQQSSQQEPERKLSLRTQSPPPLEISRATSGPGPQAGAGKLVSGEQQACQQPQQAPVELEGQVSSIAASSQTLRLFGGHAAAGKGSQQQWRPAGSERARAELAESEQLGGRLARNRVQQQQQQLGTKWAGSAAAVEGAGEQEEGAASEARNQEAGPALLGRVEEFDSKIATNRTKGKWPARHWGEWHFLRVKFAPTEVKL